jgi:hypothetical protein
MISENIKSLKTALYLLWPVLQKKCITKLWWKINQSDPNNITNSDNVLLLRENHKTLLTSSMLHPTACTGILTSVPYFIYTKVDRIEIIRVIVANIAEGSTSRYFLGDGRGFTGQDWGALECEFIQAPTCSLSPHSPCFPHPNNLML